MATSTRSDRETVVTLRLPRELHQRLSEEAKAADRGFAAEVRRRLEESIAVAGSPLGASDPWFADLLTALRHAAGAAAKLRPSPPERMLTAEDRKSREWFRQHDPDAQDTTAYECFVEAAAMLFQAFAPEGSQTVSQETGLRLSYQIATLALGQLGTRGVEAFTNLGPLDQELIARFRVAEPRPISVEADRGDEQ